MSSDPVAWGLLVTSVVLAGVTTWLAKSTRDMASATRNGVGLQGNELETLRAQVQLTRDDFDARRRAARPLLQVEAVLPNTQYMTGRVVYVAGSEPAFDVRVWGRGPAGYYGGLCGTVVPGRSCDFPNGFPTLQQGALDIEWPFPDAMHSHELAENERWVGVTWNSPDEPNGRYLRHYKVDGDSDEFHGDAAH